MVRPEDSLSGYADLITDKSTRIPGVGLEDIKKKRRKKKNSKRRR